MADLNMRKGLRRSIGYRPHVKVMYAVASLTTLITLAFVANTLITALSSENGSELLMPFMVLSGVTFAIFFMGLFLFHRLAFTHFVVEPQCLTIHRGKASEVLTYTEIEDVKLHDIPFALNMFVVTLINGKRHFFTMAIERSEYILESIYGFDPQLFKGNKLRGYRISAIVADHWAHRAEKRWRDFPTLVIKFLLAPSLAAGGYLLAQNFAHKDLTISSTGPKLLVLIGLLWLLALALNFILDVYLVSQENRKLEKDPNDLKTDMKREALLERQNRKLYLILALILTMCFTIFSN